MEACVKNGVKRFIHTSALEAVYGPDLKAYIFNEKNWAETSGKDSYSTSKIDAEKAVWELYEYYKDQLEIVSLVPATVIGPFLSKDYIGSTCRAIRRFLLGDLFYIPEMTIPLCTIEDLCQAYYLALFNDKAVGERIIICNDSLWYEELFDILKAHKTNHEDVEKYTKKLPTVKNPEMFLKGLGFMSKYIGGLH